MSAITFACIAVLAIVGLAVYAVYAIDRKASLKVSAKAPGEICRIRSLIALSAEDAHCPRKSGIHA
jgi:uncharacterized membrane protein YsdA (DUF1294 family)